MGRRKINITPILDERVRRVTFKKRRIGIIKKAMQISILTSSQIWMKIYNPEDKSLVEYCSDDCFSGQDIDISQLSQLCKFSDKDYDLVGMLDQEITKHGSIRNDGSQLSQELLEELVNLEGFNKHQLFSHSKKTADNEILEPLSVKLSTKSDIDDKTQCTQSSVLKPILNKRQQKEEEKNEQKLDKLDIRERI